jgi:hypothetical protein
MELFVNKLLAKMQESLGENVGEENLVRRYQKNVLMIRGIIGELQEYVLEHPFCDKALDVKYFKELAPPFYSQYLFQRKILEREMYRLAGGKERQLKYLEYEMEGVLQFFTNNFDFISYYYAGMSTVDEQLFSKECVLNNFWVRDELELTLDKNICLASYKTAKVLANEHYRRYLGAEIREMKNPQTPGLESWSEKTFEFDETNAAAAEWITSFSRKKLIKINGIPADTKTLTLLFELVFGRKLGNIYKVQNTNASRKKDPTPFLHSLIRAVTLKSSDN